MAKSKAQIELEEATSAVDVLTEENAQLKAQVDALTATTGPASTIREVMKSLENRLGEVMSANNKTPGSLVALQREIQAVLTNDHPLLDWSEPEPEPETETEGEEEGE